MKRITSALIACVFTLTGCAYLHDRGRDTCDVITIAAETGLANASIQIGKGTLGAGVSGGKGIGLRSGSLGIYEYAEINMILLGKKLLLPSEYDIERGKGYDYSFYWYPWRKQEDELDVELEEGGKFNLLQIELAACLGIGARVGFNFAELVDLVLGIFTIDILEDDLATIEKNEQRQHQQRMTDNTSLNPIPGSSINVSGHSKPTVEGHLKTDSHKVGFCHVLWPPKGGDHIDGKPERHDCKKLNTRALRPRLAEESHCT